MTTLTCMGRFQSTEEEEGDSAPRASLMGGRKAAVSVGIVRMFFVTVVVWIER